MNKGPTKLCQGCHRFMPVNNDRELLPHDFSVIPCIDETKYGTEFDHTKCIHYSPEHVTNICMSCKRFYENGKFCNDKQDHWKYREWQ